MSHTPEAGCSNMRYVQPDNFLCNIVTCRSVLYDCRLINDQTVSDRTEFHMQRTERNADNF